MAVDGKKSAQKEANRLSMLLRMALGEDRFPIDVPRLALEVSKNNEDPIETVVGGDLPGFEGMLRAHRKRPAWHIIYNEEPRYRGRERFTVAHELGHYMLHRPKLGQADYPDGQLARSCDFQCLPLQSNAWKVAEKLREEEADTFASYLLMPLDDYRKQVDGLEMTRGLLGHMTDRYGVSLLAAVRKWIEFTDRRAMVVATDGFALWGRASRAAFKSGVFIKSGMEIPDGSVAALGPIASQPRDDCAVAQPSGVWTFSRGSEPARELTFFSKRLGISVSLLHFDDDGRGAEITEEEPWDAYDQFTANGQFPT